MLEGELWAHHIIYNTLQVPLLTTKTNIRAFKYSLSWTGLLQLHYNVYSANLVTRDTNPVRCSPVFLWAYRDQYLCELGPPPPKIDWPIIKKLAIAHKGLSEGGPPPEKIVYEIYLRHKYVIKTVCKTSYELFKIYISKVLSVHFCIYSIHVFTLKNPNRPFLNLWIAVVSRPVLYKQ